jgi:HAMP domain-containing protein
MSLRRRLDNLPVGQKLLVALLVLLSAVLLAANLTFISAAYWISQQSVTPQAMQTLGQLIASPVLSRQALSSPDNANAVLARLEPYEPLRAAALYDPQGRNLAQFQRGEELGIPAHLERLELWRLTEFRTNLLIELPQAEGPPGHLLLVASSELPGAFYTGTLGASLAILLFSILLWLVVVREIRRLVTEPIRRLKELTRQVTREENYALRAAPGNQDEIGSLAEAFNTMLSRMQSREQQLKRARDDAQNAFDHASSLTEETRHSNRQLELEVQVRGKIEKQLTGFQNYLNSIIDSMPSALIALDDQLYVTQWNHEASQLSGTDLEQTGAARLPAAQTVSRPVARDGGTAQGRTHRTGFLTAPRRATPLHADLLSSERQGGARRGDPDRRHHRAASAGRRHGAVGKNALGWQPGRRHGP